MYLKICSMKNYLSRKINTSSEIQSIKMPVGKLNRKASNETLYSTLDSRMSSSDIPKMELLKVNYVHQCKEALMPHSSQALPLPPRLNQRLSTQAMNSNVMGYNKPPMPEPVQSGHVTKVIVGGAKAKKHTVALSPPPTVESWHLMQNAEANPTITPKFIVQCPLEDSDDNDQSDTISCCNSSCSGSTCTELEICASPDCQVSNSWDYRKQVTTHDLRRETVKNGVKSRADRIAIIERTDCDHLQTQSALKDMDVVSRINELFANSGVKPRNPLSIPPQPLRVAPQPFKEPNMRRRPYSVTPTTSACSCPSTEMNQRTCSLDSRKRTSGPVETKISRIPKPITDHFSRSVSNETNEQLQQRIKKIFQQGSQHNRKYTPQTDIKSMLKAGKSVETLIDTKQDKSEKNKKQEVRENDQQQSEFDRKLLRNACQSYGVDHHKAKVERIHIRKKRQPLLIINQLNADETKVRNDELQKTDVQYCAYKNCNYNQCSMSIHDQCETSNAEDQLKRLSLESGSDSGVSSAPDRSEQIKENNLKNLEKCSGCVNILENQHTAYVSEHCLDYAISEQEQEKLKEIEQTVGLPIKIHVRKAQNDPNDVQNFSNKNLTKISTDELMNTTKTTKQYKMNNDMKNIEQNKYKHNLQTTTIHIDENWVQDSTETLNEFVDNDLVKAPAPPLRMHRKPINCSDNSVKIFVHSSIGANENNSRASSVSALSFASQTSGCSSAASTISSDSTTSNRSSLCDCPQRSDNCCQPLRPSKEGVFIKRQQLTPPQIPPRRRNKDLRFSQTSTVSQSSAAIAPMSMDGIFWNNSYFSTVEEELNVVNDPTEDQCCCSVSSCDDDNCSYYETSCSSITDHPATPPSPLRKKSTYLQTAHNDRLISDRFTQPLDLKQNSMLHNDSIEDILIRNNKLLRKVSARD